MKIANNWESVQEQSNARPLPTAPVEDQALENEAAEAAKPEPLTYTVEEAAAALNVSTKTIRRLLDRELLTSSKALRKKLIPRQQIRDFLRATCDVPKTVR